ncbi:lytic murein transglycosylase B [Algibacillus agarilyticus]|uniref:lytic murein transglycosylase B n=1 Tax=Algibacillus agarilyticus TaxID=2234133 RepID=UPI000DD0E25A|nr:lytic murein transglycosylase B [Algibacillus agarilyticus]
MFKALLFSFLSLSIPFSSWAVNQTNDEFIAQTAEKYKLPVTRIKHWLDQANKDQTVLDAMAKPWEAKPWHQYAPIFLTEKRTQAGVKFWQKHRLTLDRVEKELGVDAAIVVAIIGVETLYGYYKGKYSALDSLYTLGFYHKSRGKFFRKELAELMVLAEDEQFSVTDIKSSYAGAMGWGQFMPSSYRYYAVDFDGDGKRDLFNNEVDAIGSVGNYFKKHRWQFGQPVAFKARVTGNEHKAILSRNLKPKRIISDILSQGVFVNADINTQDKGHLIKLKGATEDEYWLTLQNFYVISRYNHSPLYSMAVYQLSEAIKAEMAKHDE